MLSFAGWSQQKPTRKYAFRCEYLSENGKRMEILFRDSFSVANAGYSLRVILKEVEAESGDLIFSRDSSNRSFALSVEAPVPKVVEYCGKKYLQFWVESRRTDVTLLNSRLVAELVSLEDESVAELCLDGRRVNVAKTLHSRSTNRCFLVVSQRLVTNDTCMQMVLNQLLETPYLAFYDKLPLENPLNYSVAWQKENGVVSLPDVNRVKFVYYAVPFFPLNPTSTSLENEFFKVVAHPYGEIYAFDKRKKKYFVVWASEWLPREDYSKGLAWKENAPKVLKLQGVYDQGIYYLNLETGEVTKE